jgi:hypothetical protein
MDDAGDTKHMYWQCLTNMPGAVVFGKAVHIKYCQSSLAKSTSKNISSTCLPQAHPASLMQRFASSRHEGEVITAHGESFRA